MWPVEAGIIEMKDSIWIIVIGILYKLIYELEMLNIYHVN